MFSKRILSWARNVLLVVLLGLSTSCASLRCGTVRPGGDPSFQLGYFSEGDGPTVTVLRFYWGGFLRRYDAAVIEFEPVGQRRRCRKVVGGEVEELKKILKSESLASLLANEVERGNDAGIHDAFLSIQQHQMLVQRRLEITNPELLQTVEEFERLFKKEFPLLTDRYLPFLVEEFTASPEPAPTQID